MRAALLTAALLGYATTGPSVGQLAAQDAPRMAAVPAGVFLMGSEAGGSWEGPVHEVRTPAFEIGARPVTNAQFRAFRPSHESPGDKADSAPVTGVSWDDAKAYCDWLSKRTGRKITLPYEAWWERAARGGAVQKRYPWGDAPPPDGTERGNPFGVYAVSYNLWEWTADWYAGDYYGRSPQDDPRGPVEGVYRVLRGGGYRNDPASATVYTRGSARPETRSERITFRVAATTAPAPERPTVTSAAPAPRPVTPAPARPASTRPAPAASRPASAPARPASASAGQQPGGPVEVTGVAFAEENGALTVRIQTSGAARFKAFPLREPDRLVVDVLEGTGTLKPYVGSVPVGRGGVKSIRYSQFTVDPPAFRAVIDLERAMDYRVEAWPNELRVLLQAK